MTLAKNGGFTLIESVIAIIVLGISMSVMMTLVFPRVENSARSQYEVRASILAQSIMSEMLARGFDHESDPNGSIMRCDEVSAAACTTTLGPDGSETYLTFNDVDDYIGCWHTGDSTDCTLSVRGTLNDILGTDLSENYPNFRVEINVAYDLAIGPSDGLHRYKRIELTVVAGRYGKLRFSSYRGNY
ncbi:putative MSHA pilin protein MshD [Vibrio nigripulchritudo SFn27]|uniref:Putative MSHA pilin protein MshD n=1 Tax=Vibrio nigripulchritudo TaxID=28173 RepID=U4KEK7_9VIBR|nr:type II secretion system protein [Vibrio nigripulchritudo]CCN83276.1 putative MSHA pilin protein MshD [Vibrio nigripulchritudo BLFn1]CCN86786.1 putative MSHA pilin protein MshD [Vibrio nigripulchritudo SFn27]CCN95397.1 putative MSHA pilin protein MshD [Vibrio nigripulchritudo ENn2]CCO41554.1 putative MSHA pilin protein MshD [Vibrio nigripulchritudo SFn135]CCO53529.1 putative MSHA pilin protein MshD [Vibrio nigripulchritudo Wn13]